MIWLACGGRISRTSDFSFVPILILPIGTRLGRRVCDHRASGVSVLSLCDYMFCEPSWLLSGLERSRGSPLLPWLRTDLPGHARHAIASAVFDPREARAQAGQFDSLVAALLCVGSPLNSETSLGTAFAALDPGPAQGRDRRDSRKILRVVEQGNQFGDRRFRTDIRGPGPSRP